MSEVRADYEGPCKERPRERDDASCKVARMSQGGSNYKKWKERVDVGLKN